MTQEQQMLLHNGTPVPQLLIDNIAKWKDEPLTPGWLPALPEVIERLCDRWKIELEPVPPRSSMTLVLLGHSEILGPVVIKTSPLADEFRSEATALQLASGTNVSKLYDVDFDRSVMVVERIMPGTPLKQVTTTDEAATRLAAETVKTFWRPVADPTGLTALKPWCRALLEWESDDVIIPDSLVNRARPIAEYRLNHQAAQLMLHGDFHHENLLLRENGDWAIIDPKGLIGDPAFEVATWLWNPWGVDKWGDYVALTSRRIDIFTEVWGIDRQVLIEWGFFGAVLSACWYGHTPGPEEGRDGVLLTARACEALL